MSQVPVHVQACPTVTVSVYNVESQGKITVTIEGDIAGLLPHLNQMVVDALDEMGRNL